MTISTLLDQGELKFDIGSNHTFSFALNLINDEDPDVVLHAVQVLDHLKDPRALETLRSVLNHSDLNVVQAAIVAVGHLGDDSAVSDLAAFLNADPWLKIAAIQALGDIRSSLSAGPLARLLKDPAVGSLAAEALARVGGTSGLRFLAKHWIKFHRKIDTETFLSLLAHVIEGITKKTPKIPGLQETVAPYLSSPSVILRASAARCLLALGPGPEDKKAISLLAETVSDSRVLPACLRRRSDLIAYLLKKQGPQQIWGFHLMSLFQEAAPPAMLAADVRSHENYEHLDYVANALLRIKNPAIAPVILDLYLKVPVTSRHLLNPVFRLHKKQLRNLLIDLDIDDETRLVISALLGISPICVALEIFDLPKDSRILVISQIADCKAIVKAFPWSQWLENDPAGYASVAAEVTEKANLRELMPVLRKILSAYPVSQIIRTAGRLKDQESVSILVSHLDRTSSRMKAFILESLGRIGGRQAREELKNAAGALETKEARVAYRALSECAVEEDSPFFREAVVHPDWYIRLACAEFLGCYPSPENLAAIAELTTDPVSIVAQRALTFLKFRRTSVPGILYGTEDTEHQESVKNSTPLNDKPVRSEESVCS